ncbi:MAG: histone deacetylase, partial [Myxococcota bacterium]
MPPLPLYYTPLYTDAISPQARFPRDRYRLVRAALQPAIDAGRIVIHSPRRADPSELRMTHDPSYVHAFLTGTLDPKRIRRIGFRPWTDHFVERTLRLTAGTLQATEAVLAGAKVAGNLGGGTHHAYHDFGSGYCVFNDMAIAIQLALHRGQIDRAVVIDLDVHQGDGTAALFQHEPRVLTFSMHAERNFPFRKQCSDLDLGLEDGIDGPTYVELLDQALDRQIRPFGPDLMVYQAGVDPLAEDTLGRPHRADAPLPERGQRVPGPRRRWGRRSHHPCTTPGDNPTPEPSARCGCCAGAASPDRVRAVRGCLRPGARPPNTPLWTRPDGLPGRRRSP